MEIIYIALYDLKSPHKRVLNFREGERFLPLIAKQTDPDWSLGIDLQGNIGYIPCSYVRSVKVKKQELAHMIEDILEILHLKCAGTYTNEQRQIIQQLSNKRSAMLSTELTSKPQHSSCESEIFSQVNEHNVQPVFLAVSCNNETVLDELTTGSPELSQRTTDGKFESDICIGKLSENVKKEIQELKDHSGCISQIASSPAKAHVRDKAVETESLGEIQKPLKPDIPVWLVSSLIENVRSQTQLSHQNTKLAIAVVLDTLKESLPDLSCVFAELRESLNKCESILEQADSVIPSEDRRKLQHIFKQLWYCKNDEQQRSWPVHEDEIVIKALLEELYVILMDADPRISREVIQFDEYEMVHLLVTYYQMEPRRSLRMNMLHVFAALCELDITVISHLLTSILPMEIARDMQCSSDDDLKLQYSAYLLNIIFSTGQKPPNGLYEFFNERFVQFLLGMLEKFVEADQDDIANHFLSVILSFNLHFQDTSENIVLQMLKKKNDARILSEKLVLLLNREEDPTRILSHKLDTPNSVLKFLVDFFSHSDTVQLFYLNDIKVVLDITVRQLTDYFPGEQKRLWYLRLVANILKNSNYEEHYHQKKGLQKCFNTVLTQEDPCVQEMALVGEILKEFPLWFNTPSI